MADFIFYSFAAIGSFFILKFLLSFMAYRKEKKQKKKEEAARKLLEK